LYADVPGDWVMTTHIREAFDRFIVAAARSVGGKLITETRASSTRSSFKRFGANLISRSFCDKCRFFTFTLRPGHALEQLELQSAIAVLSHAELINGDESRFARKAMGLRQRSWPSCSSSNTRHGGPFPSHRRTT
jgi:hypothetical protein